MVAKIESRKFWYIRVRYGVYNTPIYFPKSEISKIATIQ